MGQFISLDDLRSQGVTGIQLDNINVLRGEVVGLQFHDYARHARDIQIGDALELRREKLNEFDRAAIGVYRDGEKIGFVSKEDNRILSVLQDNGVPLEAYVTEHNTNASIYKGGKRLMMAIYVQYTFVTTNE